MSAQLSRSLAICLKLSLPFSSCPTMGEISQTSLLMISSAAAGLPACTKLVSTAAHVRVVAQAKGQALSAMKQL